MSGIDALSTVENAIGTSADDVIVGDTDANRLSGGPGNDLLIGVSGIDTGLGGAGADR